MKKTSMLGASPLLFDAAGISIPYNQLDVHICPESEDKKAGKGDK